MLFEGVNNLVHANCLMQTRVRVTLPGRPDYPILGVVSISCTACLITETFLRKHLLGKTFPWVGGSTITYDDESLRYFEPGTKVGVRDAFIVEENLGFLGVVSVPFLLGPNCPSMVSCIVVKDMFSMHASHPTAQQYQFIFGWEFFSSSYIKVELVLGEGGRGKIQVPEYPPLVRLKHGILKVTVASTWKRVDDKGTKTDGVIAMVFEENSCLNFVLTAHQAIDAIKSIIKEVDKTLKHSSLNKCKPAKTGTQLLAVLMALCHAHQLKTTNGYFFDQVVVESDSETALQMMDQIKSLKAGYKGKDKRGPQNKDLLLIIDAVADRLSFSVDVVGLSEKSNQHRAAMKLLEKTRRKDMLVPLRQQQFEKARIPTITEEKQSSFPLTIREDTMETASIRDDTKVRPETMIPPPGFHFVEWKAETNGIEEDPTSQFLNQQAAAEQDQDLDTVPEHEVSVVSKQEVDPWEMEGVEMLEPAIVEDQAYEFPTDFTSSEIVATGEQDYQFPPHYPSSPPTNFSLIAPQNQTIRLNNTLEPVDELQEIHADLDPEDYSAWYALPPKQPRPSLSQPSQPSQVPASSGHLSEEQLRDSEPFSSDNEQSDGILVDSALAAINDCLDGPITQTSIKYLKALRAVNRQDSNLTQSSFSFTSVAAGYPGGTKNSRIPQAGSIQSAADDNPKDEQEAPDSSMARESSPDRTVSAPYDSDDDHLFEP